MIPISKPIVWPFRDLRFFSTTSLTNSAISVVSGILFTPKSFFKVFTLLLFFFNNSFNLSVLVGPGAILITEIFFFLNIIDNDLSTLTKAILYALDNIIFSLGSFTCRLEIKKIYPFLFNETFWLGASYRINESAAAIGGLADFQVSKQLRLGYAYEYPISDLRAYTSGTHEVLIMFEIFKSKRIKSPRYF